MEHKKLEALREKGVALNLMGDEDYANARERLQKAQQLFPSLDHVIPMLTVCDILSTTRNQIPGYGDDHYWVLNLTPSSSSSDVRYRYQKLMTMLQPIKTKCPGSELALKYVNSAYSVLSDPGKRSEFDLKRRTSWENYTLVDHQESCCDCVSCKQTRIIAQSSSVCDTVSSAQILDGKSEAFSADMLTTGSGDMKTKPPALADTSEPHANIASHKSNISSNSNSSPEFNTIDLMDMSGDSVNLQPVPSLSSEVMGIQDFYDFGRNRKNWHLTVGQIWETRKSSKDQNFQYAQIRDISKTEVSVTWLKPIPVSEGERRWCDAGLPVACGSFCWDAEMTEKLTSPIELLCNCSWVPGVTEKHFEIYPKRGEIWAVFEDWDLHEWASNPDILERSKLKIVEILDFSKYFGARGACLAKVDGFNSVFERQTVEGNPVILHVSPESLYMLSHKVPAYLFTGNEIDGAVRGTFELDLLAMPCYMEQMDTQMVSKEDKAASSNFVTSVEQSPSLKPNLDSTVIGSTWFLNDFSPGQVWAVYCGINLMPQRYARVNSLISGSQVCVSFLVPEAILDHETIWNRSILPISCGVFRASISTVNIEISKLSHPVRCQQNTTGLMCFIYPIKGEVWALYQNWNGKWKLSDYQNCQCCLVEILSDFSEGEKMIISRLEEVNGLLTFFQRRQHNGFDLTREVSKNEMLSFSHSIPAFRVPGIGKYGIPESSWHLEPNALPFNHRI